jgi:integrase
MVGQKERERYVDVRKKRDGSERYIWNRKGFKAEALPEDWEAAMQKARRLNNQAARGILKRKAEAAAEPDNTLAWYCDAFEASAAFKALAAQTRLNYRTQLATLRATFPSQRIASFKKKSVKRYLETIASLGGRRTAKSVLRHLFEMALDDELIDRNPADNIELPGVKARRQLWDADTIARLLAACDVLDRPAPGHYEKTGRAEAMRRAVRLLEYTGQRPCDVLKMAWAHDDGQFVRVRQQKTGKLVEIWRGELGVLLDAWKAALPALPASEAAPFATIVHGPDGRRYTMKWFTKAFRRVARAAGIAEDLQARDLRRTAVTNLYEAGCSEGLISAITGHDIETCRRILEHYFVRTREASKAAVTRLDQHRERKRRAAAAED